MAEKITIDQFRNALRNDLPTSALQRLGYILDRMLDKAVLSSEIEKKLKNRVLHRVPLDGSLEKAGKR